MREVFPVGKRYRLRVRVTLAEVDELGNDVEGTVTEAVYCDFNYNWWESYMIYY